MSRAYRVALIAGGVGTLYALLLILLNRELGHDAAAIAGIGFTVVAVGACQKSEKLWSEQLVTNKLELSRATGFAPFMFTVVALNGVQVFLGFVYGLYFDSLRATRNLALIVTVIILQMTIAYGVGGMLIVAAIPNVRLVRTMWAGLLCYVLNFVLGVLPIWHDRGWQTARQAFGFVQASCFLYIVAVTTPIFLIQHSRSRTTRAPS